MSTRRRYPEEVWGRGAARRDGREPREQRKPPPRSLFDAGATGVVVKAQIHAGGRGKGGGVKIAKSVAGGRRAREQDPGHDVDYHQTGPEGRVVRRLLIEETLPIEKELYLGIVIDRAEAGQCLWHQPRVEWKSNRWRRRILRPS